MTGTVQKWGNSMAVRLPKALARKARIEKGTRVEVEVRGRQIVVTPISKPVYRLEDLVRKITKKNRHPAIDAGAPRGQEVW